MTGLPFLPWLLLTVARTQSVEVSEEVVYYDIYYDPDYAFNYSYEGINPEPDLTRPTERPPSRWTLDDTQATHERDNDATRDAEAPVTEVHLEQVGDTAVCSSVGIYPEPELTWSTEPPSGRNLSATTAVWRTSQLLYDIRSSLLLSPEDAGLVYVCTVVSGESSKKATVKVKRGECLLRRTVCHDIHRCHGSDCLHGSLDLENAKWKQETSSRLGVGLFTMCLSASAP
uniref:HERV-H LTR-associated protein 2-like n=1 Tax=Oryzias latipes TaxID=8090 RepID=A0A286P9S0_ORYLA|nr:HERV-H LTR-associated protein 2-like [Oryzias latipes]